MKKNILLKVIVTALAWLSVVVIYLWYNEEEFTMNDMWHLCVAFALLCFLFFFHYRNKDRKEKLKE